MSTTSGTDTQYTMIANSELEGLYASIRQLQAEITRLKAKVNRLVESLDTEGVYQAEDRSDYLAEREEIEPAYQQKPAQEWREGRREE